MRDESLTCQVIAGHLLVIADVDAAVGHRRVVPRFRSAEERLDSPQFMELLGRRFHQHKFAGVFRHADDQIVAQKNLPMPEAFSHPWASVILPDLLAVLEVHAFEVAIVQAVCVVAVLVFAAHGAGELAAHHRVLGSPNLLGGPSAIGLRDTHKATARGSAGIVGCNKHARIVDDDRLRDVDAPLRRPGESPKLSAGGQIVPGETFAVKDQDLLRPRERSQLGGRITGLVIAGSPYLGAGRTVVCTDRTSLGGTRFALRD